MDEYMFVGSLSGLTHAVGEKTRASPLIPPPPPARVPLPILFLFLLHSFPSLRERMVRTLWPA